MSHTTNLCIVIPTFNRKQQLATLLGQLKKQQNVEGTVVKIVVVVDGSTDGTLELLKSEFADVVVVLGNGNWWFTRSLNEGCKYAVNTLHADFVLTLNDDVEIPTGYLHEMMRNYKQCEVNSLIGSSSYSLATPRMITFSGFKSENKWTQKYHKYVKSFTLMEPGSLKGVARSVTLPTRGLLIPAFVMKEVNYFDEKTFPQYGSDYDFVLRSAKKGTSIYVSYDGYLFENMQLTSSGNPRLVKTLKAYLQNIFFNRYSSNYFFNRINMSWRFGIKFLFPFYFFIALVAIPYVYIKYKYSVNKRIQVKS